MLLSLISFCINKMRVAAHKHGSLCRRIYICTFIHEEVKLQLRWSRREEKKRQRELERKRRARTIQLKDTSCLYFLSLVQISTLESVSGNKSSNKPECEWASAAFVCEIVRVAAHSHLLLLYQTEWVKDRLSSLPPPYPSQKIAPDLTPPTLSPSSTSSGYNWWSACSGWLSHQSSVCLALCFAPSNMTAFFVCLWTSISKFHFLFLPPCHSITPSHSFGLSSSFNLPCPCFLRIHLTQWPNVLWWMLIGSHTHMVQYSEE